MDSSKYIVLEEIDGAENVYVFSNVMDHREFLNRVKRPDEKIVSAGFVSVFTNEDDEPECSCIGESVTIGVKARPERDGFLVNQMMRTGNFYT
jgi:hypothetical protein